MYAYFRCDPEDFERPLTVIMINRNDIHNIHIVLFARSVTYLLLLLLLLLLATHKTGK